MNNSKLFPYRQNLNKFKRVSLEFLNGTKGYFPRVVNPVEGDLKIIYESKPKSKFTVFHEKGKDAIPRCKHLDAAGLKYKTSFDWTSVMFIASRICVEYDNGEMECLKSRMGSPMLENSKEILDAKTSAMKFSIETGKKPTEVFEEDLEA